MLSFLFFSYVAFAKSIVRLPSVYRKACEFLGSDEQYVELFRCSGICSLLWIFGSSRCAVNFNFGHFFCKSMKMFTVCSVSCLHDIAPKFQSSSSSDLSAVLSGAAYSWLMTDIVWLMSAAHLFTGALVVLPRGSRPSSAELPQRRLPRAVFSWNSLWNVDIRRTWCVTVQNTCFFCFLCWTLITNIIIFIWIDEKFQAVRNVFAKFWLVFTRVPNQKTMVHR